MFFQTIIERTKCPFQLSHNQGVMLLGSCFTTNMGIRLDRQKFPTYINPFGTLYNPLSIASSLWQLLEKKDYKKDDLFEFKGLYHSWSHHSVFSKETKEDCLIHINEKIQQASEQLTSTSSLILTFGSAYVYRLKENNQIVANCHKLPESSFCRKRMAVLEIVEAYQELLPILWERFPNIKLLLTVSPIRHRRDGFHENQLSKSVLLLAIDELVKLYPQKVGYFPAYEIMMDELRDYRFYADDMIHPSSLAIEYIGEQFQEFCYSSKSLEFITKWNKIVKALQHRPFNPDSINYQKFKQTIKMELLKLKSEFPQINISKELSLVVEK